VTGLPTTTSAGDRGGRPRIGKYVIVGRIGRGGMGMVYRGYDEALDREVAVKTLTLDGALDEESRKRFAVEAKAAAKLQHPNIVTVFELNQDGKLQYIAMELLPGCDLETLLRSGETLLLPEKLDVVIQVCRGLQFAHERGVVHRDIKPSNIRLLDDGSVKIMDFGIAKLANTDLTRSGMMVGTVHYMCPEQIQGHPVDGRSDVFSVGVILFELLSGRRPFEGVQGGATEILYKIVQEPTPPLPALGTHTAALQKVANRALAKKPSDRYASAARLADDLEQLRDQLELLATPTTDEIETIETARQLVSEGRVDEGVTRLREMVERTPESVEARRALRAACREAARRTRSPEPEGDFPELTYQVGATALQQATSLMPTDAPAPDPASVSGAIAAAEGKTMLVAGAIVLGFALVAGALLVLRSPGKEEPAHSAADAPAGAKAAVPPGPGSTASLSTVATPGLTVEGTASPAPPPAAPKLARVKLATEPPGAAVTVDGKPLAGVTPLEIDVDPRQPHQVSFALDGFLGRRVTIAAGGAKDMTASLIAAGPPGTVAVSSKYPVDVLLGDIVLARGASSPTVSVPAGRHTLRIVSSAVFLRMSPTVEVKAGETTVVPMPELGQLSAQANPDSCEVFVDGETVGYLPIRRKPVAPGRHTVVFKWPDGARDEKTVEVEPGVTAYVTGEK
jgi:hypothetical protein